MNDKEKKLKILRQMYLQLAKEFHPDISHDQKSLEKFQNIQLNYRKIKENIDKWNGSPIPMDNQVPKKIYSIKNDFGIKVYKMFTVINLQQNLYGGTLNFTVDNKEYRTSFSKGIMPNKMIRVMFPRNITKKLNSFVVNITFFLKVEKPYELKQNKLILNQKISFFNRIFCNKINILVPNRKKISLRKPYNFDHKKMYIIENEGLFNRESGKNEPLYIRFIPSFF